MFLGLPVEQIQYTNIRSLLNGTVQDRQAWYFIGRYEYAPPAVYAP